MTVDNAMKSKAYANLQNLSNEQLIQLSNELKQVTIPPDAILRQVIKDSELDSTAPMLAFVGIGQLLGHVLAERLTLALNDIKKKEDEIQRIYDNQKLSY